MSCIANAELEPAISVPAIRPPSSAKPTSESESGWLAFERLTGALPYVGAEPVPLKFCEGLGAVVPRTVLKKPPKERKTGRRRGRDAVGWLEEVLLESGSTYSPATPG